MTAEPSDRLLVRCDKPWCDTVVGTYDLTHAGDISLESRHFRLPDGSPHQPFTLCLCPGCRDVVDLPAAVRLAHARAFVGQDDPPPLSYEDYTPTVNAAQALLAMSRAHRADDDRIPAVDRREHPRRDQRSCDHFEWAEAEPARPDGTDWLWWLAVGVVLVTALTLYYALELGAVRVMP